MDGTLSPDKNYVVHGGKWVPAQLSPSHTHYAYDGQWHLLKSHPVPEKVEKKVSNCMEADRGELGEASPRQYRMVFNAFLFILTIVYAWRGFDFYRNNSGQIFFDNLREGLTETLYALWFQPSGAFDNIAMIAGWSHPAFGICCIIPALWIFLNLPYFADRMDWYY